MSPMLWIAGLSYVAAFCAAFYGWIAELRWPYLFSLVLAATAVICHVAELLYEDDGRDCDRDPDA